MAVLVYTEIITLDVLEWGDEFSPEQQDYIDKVIETFKLKLENYLVYRISGFFKIYTTFEFNPKTLKFKLIKCNSPLKFHVENALNGELKIYKG